MDAQQQSKEQGLWAEVDSAARLKLFEPLECVLGRGRGCLSRRRALCRGTWCSRKPLPHQSRPSGQEGKRSVLEVWGWLGLVAARGLRRNAEISTEVVLVLFSVHPVSPVSLCVYNSVPTPYAGTAGAPGLPYQLKMDQYQRKTCLCSLQESTINA